MSKEAPLASHREPKVEAMKRRYFLLEGSGLSGKADTAKAKIKKEGTE